MYGKSRLLLVGLVVSGVQTVQNIGCDVETLIGIKQTGLADDDVETVSLVVFLYSQCTIHVRR